MKIFCSLVIFTCSTSILNHLSVTLKALRKCRRQQIRLLRVPAFSVPSLFSHDKLDVGSSLEQLAYLVSFFLGSFLSAKMRSRNNSHGKSALFSNDKPRLRRSLPITQTRLTKEKSAITRFCKNHLWASVHRRLYRTQLAKPYIELIPN